MNTFELSRNFCNWAFDNPEKVNPNHYAIYFFAIEHCNRLGGKEKFGFPSQMTMEAIGIKKHQTYIKYFNELVEYGFFKLIQKSKNQYSANIISINSAIPKKDKALDKAFIKHTAKQTESTGQSTGQSKDSIDKPINNKTKEQLINRFLDWFNSSKEILLKEKGRFRKLSKTDYNNLLELKKHYNANDFEKAIKSMSENEWVKENDYFVPAHFLRNDNFTKYLNAKPKKEKTDGFYY